MSQCIVHAFLLNKVAAKLTKADKNPCRECLVCFFFFLDLDLITDIKFSKRSQHFYEQLNSPLVKVLPCLTKLMA